MIELTKRLKKIVNKCSYTREWRTKTAICLLALGMSETGIESAITGQLDNMKDCYRVCKAQGLSFNDVWKALH